MNLIQTNPHYHAGANIQITYIFYRMLKLLKNENCLVSSLLDFPMKQHLLTQV